LESQFALGFRTEQAKRKIFIYQDYGQMRFMARFIFYQFLFVGPIIGLIIGPLLEENLRWRKDPVRTKVYMKATALWVGMFAVRLLVQYPLYISGNVNALGTARLIMGYPLFIAVAWATWIVIKSGPKLRDDLRVVN